MQEILPLMDEISPLMDKIMSHSLEHNTLSSSDSLCVLDTINRYEGMPIESCDMSTYMILPS
jgi:hypothetical protein